MDCSICGVVPLILRTHRNLICMSCFEAAKSCIAFVSKSDSAVSQSNSSKGFGDALKLIKEMKEREEILTEKLSFLGGLVVAFKDGIHTDIHIKSSNGSSIPAHRALLAARSEVFKNMLESDECKAPPTDATISLPELNNEELQALLEFLYSGTLPVEKLSKHVYSLYIAADKYEITFLLKFCERWMLGSLNSWNALDVLEIADVCPNKTLRDSAMSFVLNHMEDIVYTDGYEEFAMKNPHLNAQLTRALVTEMRAKESC